MNNRAGGLQMLQEISAMGLTFDPALKRAFLAVDRANFVLPEYRQSAYENRPLPIGFGQTISQPYTVAFMLKLLNPKQGEKILEVGSGSGWQTGLLAFLVGDQGKIVAMERVKDLYKMGQKNLSAYPTLLKRCRFICDNGRGGCAEEAPFDAIIAAASGSSVPLAWKVQVRTGGRIIMPIGQSIVKLTKLNKKEFAEESFSGFLFVPLI